MADETTVDTTTVVTPPAAQTWHAGLEPDVLGHIQSKGWDTLDPSAAAKEAAKAHREAQKYLGAGVDKLVRIPDPADPASVKAFRDKMGVPADAKDYDFTGVKTAAGEVPDQAFLDFARSQAAELGLNKDDASRLATAMLKQSENTVTARVTEDTAKLQLEQATLDKNWGANKEANMFVAKQAAAKLGVTPEQIAALEKTVGYAATMELFRTIGTKIGEDRFIQNPNPAIPGVMTRDQAVTRKNDLMKDEGWRNRYLAGGAAENKELQGLLTIITGEDSTSYQAA